MVVCARCGFASSTFAYNIISCTNRRTRLRPGHSSKCLCVCRGHYSAAIFLSDEPLESQDYTHFLSFVRLVRSPPLEMNATRLRKISRCLISPTRSSYCLLSSLFASFCITISSGYAYNDSVYFAYVKAIT